MTAGEWRRLLLVGPSAAVLALAVAVLGRGADVSPLGFILFGAAIALGSVALIVDDDRR